SNGAQGTGRSFSSLRKLRLIGEISFIYFSVNLDGRDVTALKPLRLRPCTSIYLLYEQVKWPIVAILSYWQSIPNQVTTFLQHPIARSKDAANQGQCLPPDRLDGLVDDAPEL